MDPKIENHWHQHAICSIPNGGIYYDNITEYIRTKYGWPSINEDFMNDIADKIIEISNDILSGKFFGLVDKTKTILCGQYFWIDDKANVLHIEVRIGDGVTSVSMKSETKYTFLVVPIGLEKSLPEIRHQGIQMNSL